MDTNKKMMLFRWQEAWSVRVISAAAIPLYQNRTLNYPVGSRRHPFTEGEF
jgi:hypothetical protein